MSAHPLQPLRLAVGSHEAGSGRGCAMNVVSWESGDSTITDMPACADPMLALLVQQVNDEVCYHRDGDLLCPTCSVAVLALAHRTVGTALDESRSDDGRRAWVTIALEEAEPLLWFGSVGWEVCQGLRRWLAGTATPYDMDRIHHHITEASALGSIVDARIKRQLGPLGEREPLLAWGHRIIDRWEDLTGVTGRPPDPEVTAHAVAAMTGGLR